MLKLPENMHMYYGDDGFQEWIKDCDNVEGGTVSPGGAVRIIKVSRQRIYKMIATGVISSWVHCKDHHSPGGYMCVSIKECEEYRKINYPRKKV